MAHPLAGQPAPADSLTDIPSFPARARASAWATRCSSSISDGFMAVTG